jgi:hypothetical protein
VAAIDYIFASPALIRYLDTCNIIDTRLARRASDHLPVMQALLTGVEPLDYGRRSFAMRALINGEKWPAYRSWSSGRRQSLPVTTPRHRLLPQ